MPGSDYRARGSGSIIGANCRFAADLSLHLFKVDQPSSRREDPLADIGNRLAGGEQIVAVSSGHAAVEACGKDMVSFPGVIVKMSGCIVRAMGFICDS